MQSELRICSAGDLPHTIVYESSKKFTSLSGYHVSEFCRDLIHGLNAAYSIHSKNEGVGMSVDSSTDTDSGCLGRLQKNESDMMVRRITYPQETANLIQGAVVVDSVIQVISVYETKENTTTAQMISSFASFDLTVWSLCVLTLIGGYLILSISKKMFLDHLISLTLVAFRSPITVTIWFLILM